MGALEIFLIALGAILLWKLGNSNIRGSWSIEPRRPRKGDDDDDDEQRPGPPMLEP